MRGFVVIPMAIALSTPAMAQQITSSSVSGQDAPVKKLLTDGYDIKAGFSDNSGGAYMLLQKATSAYLCHSNPTPTCEKLN